MTSSADASSPPYTSYSTSDAFSNETPPSTLGSDIYASSSKETRSLPGYSRTRPSAFREKDAKNFSRRQQLSSSRIQRVITYSPRVHKGHSTEPTDADAVEVIRQRDGRRKLIDIAGTTAGTGTTIRIDQYRKRKEQKEAGKKREPLQYQNDVGGPTVPLTAEMLRRRQRRESGSSSSTRSSASRSTKSSASRDESDYKKSTRSRSTSDNDDDRVDGDVGVISVQGLVRGVNKGSRLKDPGNLALRFHGFKQNTQSLNFHSCTSAALNTISRDNTTGDDARNTKLLVEFAQKQRSEALLGLEQKPNILSQVSTTDEYNKRAVMTRIGIAEYRKGKEMKERGEMTRGDPIPRPNPFEYEIRTAEPRVPRRKTNSDLASDDEVYSDSSITTDSEIEPSESASRPSTPPLIKRHNAHPLPDNYI